ncbi:MAG: RNA-directed DNA polymerase [Hungatella sp.]|nr:RNA-directed DNA polymerase [Hungatella sp.]
MWEYRGLWKYCGKEQIKDMLLSFQLLGDTDWPKEKILACLFALSNHPESHYHSVKIPKRRGGYRTLDVPDGLLKKVQRNILHHILDDFAPSQAATAYGRGTSVISNAFPHTGKRLVLKLDIHDFFGNITFPMVLHKAFPGTYFPASVGTMLTSLCCLRERLPQGSPASPAISNLVMRPFDEYMLDWCGQREIAYSRYSDDMTFSGDFDAAELLRKTESFLRIYGLELNHEKTRLCTRGSRQIVTGIVVNETLQLPKEYRRELRQEIHYCRRFGVEDHLGRQKDTDQAQAGEYLMSLLGKVAYLLSVNPQDTWFQDAEKFLREELRKRGKPFVGQ